METKIKLYLSSSILVGFIMWVIGGLYHNLILPNVNSDIHAHHDGLVLALIAYIILALFMTFIFDNLTRKKSLINGLLVGCMVGIIWVFPHGITMAGIHKTSILYEIKNTLYHIIEQGLGGILMYYIANYFYLKI